MTDSRSASPTRLNPIHSGNSTRVQFPVLRWAAVGWLAVWIPVYWHAWGWQNFLHLCDVAVILSCAGIILGSRLLISSQALATLIPGFVWSLDAGWRIAFGHNLMGGTEYLWDASQPLWIRMLSLFHVVLPVLLVMLCIRFGYDRRALAIQSGITIALLVVSRWIGVSANLNYALLDPVFHRQLGAAPIHIGIIFVGIVAVFYLPAHVLLRRNVRDGNSTNFKR